MKQRFAVTHTISQTEITASLDVWIMNTPSVEMLFSQKNIGETIILVGYIFVRT